MINKNNVVSLNTENSGTYDDTYIKLSKYRMIFIYENITKTLAAEISSLLLYYDNENSEEAISLYIHSDGGDADALVNIYDVMQMVKSPIRTICLGKCSSAAAVLLLAGTKGERYALPHSSIMLHGIQCHFPIPGHNILNSKDYFSFIKENNDSIMKIIAKHTGNKLDKIKKDCLNDKYFAADAAVSYGIIDHILI